MKAKLVSILIILICFMSLSLFSESSETEIDPRAILAMSNPEYRITAGDVYVLAYAAGSTAVKYELIVDSTYKLRVSNLAVIDVEGRTFVDVKNQVEQIVSKNYPLSGVQFVLKSPAVFTVTLKGEVSATAEPQTWALQRLSSLIGSYLTSYSSTRNIKIISKNGKATTYDLFKASRNGDLSQNPYLRPGDTIQIGKLSRSVSISGAVERPGTYQLLEGENLKDLIEVYGSGYNPLADQERIEIVRMVEASSKTGERLYVSRSDFETVSLKNLDSVMIPQVSDYLPVVYVEGSVVDLSQQKILDDDEGGKLALNDMNSGKARIVVRYVEGETWGSLVQRNKEWFSAYSDTGSSYIIRKGERIPLDLDKLLFTALASPSPVIEANDTLVVPYRQKEAQVVIKGEVISAKEHNGWPLRRLSEFVSDNLTPYSSVRDIEIKDASGVTRVYDYFRSFRYGEFEQNPWVRPGDTITIKRLSRSVSISGAVERPGTYQLLEGENLKDLIEVYGSGLTPQADISRIELVRYVDSKYAAGEKLFFNRKNLENNEKLQNLDSISIPQITDLSPVMFIEGAVGVSSSENGVFVSPENANKIDIQFNQGENYASLVRRYKSLFSAVSDLYNAYIIRGTEEIPINLNPILYDATFFSGQFVEANDTLIVPFRQYFVTVSGAVRAPGRYPYIPDRDWSYYVSLAGGFIKTENANNSIVIKDILGKTHKKTEPITPETVIEAKSNSFFFYFNLYSPIVVTTLSVITTFLTFLAITAK